MSIGPGRFVYRPLAVSTARPGDLVLSRMLGGVGVLVLLGEKLIGDDSGFGHVDVVVNALGDPGFPRGRVVRAMPRGAEFADLVPRLAPTHAVCAMPLTDEQRAMVPAVAQRFVSARGGRGTPYSFRSYLALSLIHWGFTPTWLLRWIARTGELMCSQLADELLRRVGFHLFDDGGWPGDVTPGDIDHRTDPRYIQPAPMVGRVTRRKLRKAGRDMAVKDAIPVVRDLLERVVATFVMAAGGVALADGVGLADIVHLDLWKAAGVGGLAAVLSLVKGLFAAWSGGGASADPGVKLAPKQQRSGYATGGRV